MPKKLLEIHYLRLAWTGRALREESGFACPSPQKAKGKAGTIPIESQCVWIELQPISARSPSVRR